MSLPLEDALVLDLTNPAKGDQPKPALKRDEWFGRWSEAEAHYFRAVMPPEGFDLVV